METKRLEDSSFCVNLYVRAVSAWGRAFLAPRKEAMRLRTQAAALHAFGRRIATQRGEVWFFDRPFRA